ncbi:hypothetical protein G9A89_018119 [Geosiphon pyriformis]|nr:hypothetical protein G9A89_018119 [Geosiphon pyriformis]
MIDKAVDGGVSGRNVEGSRGFCLFGLGNDFADWTFEKVLAENILAGLVVFTNANRILGKLFEHRAIELQATSWMSRHPLKVPINLLIDPMNCFLAGATHVLKLCNLLLDGNLPDVFQAKNSIAVLDVLDLESYLCVTKSLRRYSIVFVHQLLDRRDDSIKGLGSLSVHGGAAAYFPDANVSIVVKVDGLLSSTLVELQVIALALECVFAFRSVNLFTDSQASLDLCKSGGGVIEDRPVSRNACHIAKKLFNAVHSVGWEAKCVGSFISVDLCNCFDKTKTFCVWHPDGKIKSGYTMAKMKKLYNPRYPSIACIRCGLVENSDHVFSYTYDANVRETLLSDASMEWNVVLRISTNGNMIANLLHKARSSINLFTVLAKGFVLKG